MTAIEEKDLGALDHARACAAQMTAHMARDVCGRDDVLELVTIALLAGGHVLLEDFPGSGKTLLAKALGGAFQTSDAPDEIPSFRRIQFTPDLLPSDITGVMVFDAESQTFHFRRGPLFACVVLADEINRTTPKVQSALLESMAESQITVDNETYPLGDFFFVIATQNPLDQIGTYPLPVAQLDRFLFKIRMKHIDRAAELKVLQTWGLPFEREVLPQIARADVLAARNVIRREVQVSELVQACLIDLAQALRADRRCSQGVSTRSLVQAIPALQVRAALHQRSFVSPEDVQALAVPLFQHRLVLQPGAGEAEEIVRDALREPLETLNRAMMKP